MLFVPFLFIVFQPTVRAVGHCPIQGSDFPVPTNISASSIFRSATCNLTAALNLATETGSSAFGPLDNKTSFSIGVFSTKSLGLLYSYNHQPESIESSTVGTKHVTTDTIFRIGSLSKLITIYTFLIQAGESHFHEPVTKYLPELQVITQSHNSTLDRVENVNWNDITVGDLASHLGDIGRASSETDLTIRGPISPNSGLPVLEAADLPACGIVPACNRTQFFSWFSKRHPVFAPATTPIYSNTGYQLLGYILETVTNSTYTNLLNEALLTPLKLTHTSTTKPQNDSLGIIPSNDTATYTAWSLDYQALTPVGGLYSSIKDLSTIGRSILTSSFLPTSTTRRWMKPQSFTANPTYAVGKAWEIRRYTLPSSTSTTTTTNYPRIIDIYTKSGDTMGYASMMALFPDYNIGFNVLTAGGSSAAAASGILSSLITTQLIPAVEKAAREEATSRFARRYESADAKVNSSITLITSSDSPGLQVSSWISNGTDFLSTLSSLLSPLAGTAIMPSVVSVVLYPTNLHTQVLNGTSKISFRATVQMLEDEDVDEGEDREMGPFNTGCVAWAEVDSLVYGNMALDEFVFLVDDDDDGGEVLSLEIPALRVLLV